MARDAPQIDAYGDGGFRLSTGRHEGAHRASTRIRRVSAAVMLAQDWRGDKGLRQLEAMLIAADQTGMLIVSGTGEVIEFCDPEIEALQERIAARLGYRLIGHRLELYAKKLAD